jgi:glycosyltransferase involved in cell wall biosynthesis
MRIAFLCKRRYMGKDVVLDRYARLYEMPRQLARRGHDVLGLCLAYRDDADGQWEHEAAPGRFRWHSRRLGRTRLAGLMTYPRQCLKQLLAFDPELIIAASDIPHVLLGNWLARRLKVPFVADLYDNFESFGLARIPGAVSAYRRAVRDAALVSCTSAALAEHVRGAYAARGRVIALASTVDRECFRPRDPLECRASLGLPTTAKLVGTAGGLLADRGIGTLYEAFALLARERDDVHLVLAGPADPAFPPPPGARVHYLGLLSHQRTAQLFAALDVGVIYLRDTPFGRFCFPQKAYEMAACGLATVAADVGAMHELLMDTPDCLYRPDDAASLCEALQHQLEAPKPPFPVPGDWADAIAGLDEAIASLRR